MKRASVCGLAWFMMACTHCQLPPQRLIFCDLEYQAHAAFVVVAGNIVVAGRVGEDVEAGPMDSDALHLCRPLRGDCGQRIEIGAFVRCRCRVLVFRRLLGGDSGLGLDFGGRAYLRVVHVGCLWRRWRPRC